MVKRHAVNMKDFSSTLKLGVVSSSVDKNIELLPRMSGVQIPPHKPISLKIVN